MPGSMFGVPRLPGQLAARASDQLKRQPSLAKSGLGEDADHHFEAAAADYKQATRAAREESRRRVPMGLAGQPRVAVRPVREMGPGCAPTWRPRSGWTGAGRSPIRCLPGPTRDSTSPTRHSSNTRRAIALKPDWAALYRARAYLDISREDQTSSHRSRALSDLDQAIRFESPANPVVAYDQTNRARLLLEEHREVEALAACEAAIKVRPRDHDAHQLRIRVLLEMRKYDDVIRSCDALLAQEKSSAPLYELRGLCGRGSRTFRARSTTLRRRSRFEPDQALLYVRRGVFTWFPTRRSWPAAISKRPRGWMRSDGDALVGRGAARVRLGEHREAVIDAREGNFDGYADCPSGVSGRADLRAGGGCCKERFACEGARRGDARRAISRSRDGAASRCTQKAACRRTRDVLARCCSGRSRSCDEHASAADSGD